MGIDMRLLELLRAASAPSSASLREALTQAETDRAEAVARLDRLQARRAELLLAGDDDALDTLERDLTQAQRAADRLDLAVIQGEERLRQAEAAERQAELDGVVAEGEALVSEAVTLIQRTYPPAARKLLQLATRLQAIDTTLAELNRRLAASGDSRRLPDYDRVARPSEPQELSYLSPEVIGRRRFHDQLTLPSCEQWFRHLHPAENAFGKPLGPGESPPTR